MKKRNAREFIDNNRELLIDLCKRVKNAESGSVSYEEFTAKKAAREIIEAWVSEIFSTAFSIQDIEDDDEDNLYRVLEKRHLEGREDA